MAMRLGHMIRTHARNINNLSGVSTPLRSRSFASKVISWVMNDPTGIPARAKAFGYCVLPSACMIWGGQMYHFDVLYLRTLYVEKKSEREAQELLSRLDSEKLKSEDAYLEMLERELSALKEKISNERCLDRFRMKIYRREVAALNEKIKPSLRSMVNENNPPKAKAKAKAQAV